jgi:hypothetical protein
LFETLGECEWSGITLALPPPKVEPQDFLEGNTMPLALPSTRICARYGIPRWAAIACAIWIVGRIIGTIGHCADEIRRDPGPGGAAFSLG